MRERLWQMRWLQSLPRLRMRHLAIVIACIVLLSIEVWPVAHSSRAFAGGPRGLHSIVQSESDGLPLRSRTLRVARTQQQLVGKVTHVVGNQSPVNHEYSGQSWVGNGTVSQGQVGNSFKVIPAQTRRSSAKQLSVTNPFTEYAIPSPGNGPTDIAQGSDGALWFTLTNSNRIGQLTTTGTITQFPLPTTNAGLQNITAGPDGTLWFTENNANKIGSITTGGIVTEFDLFNPVGPYGITTGPDGALWFTENSSTGNQIGRITTSGFLTLFPLPTANAGAEFITTGSDGALWFSENSANQIGRITTTGSITEFVLPTSAAGPEGISGGPDGSLWFVENSTNKIGRISTAGLYAEFGIPTLLSNPVDITDAGDGTLVFTEESAGQIGRITSSGNVSEYPVPTTNAKPLGITKGQGGKVYFTEFSANKIGALKLPALPATQPDLAITESTQSGTSTSYHVGQSISSLFTISNGETAATVNPVNPITVDIIIPSGLSNITISADSEWQILLASQVSPTYIYATYMGSAPVTAGKVLPAITISGTLTTAAAPALITMAVVQVADDSNPTNNLVTNTMLVANP